MQIISINLFGKEIAKMYQDGDRVYLEQLDEICHKVSPLAIPKNIKEIETTNLVHFQRVAGFISDSLPGNFGDEILNNYFLLNLNRYPSVSDKLLFVGNQGLGAVVYEPSIQKENDMSQSIELKEMFERVKELKRGGKFHSLHNVFLVGAHSFAGGARSKAIGAINLENNTVFLGDRTKPLENGYMHAIIKYDDTNSNENKATYSKIEYIYYQLAKECGLNMSECYLVKSGDRHHFVTKRFDIESNGKRYHVHSLAGLLGLDYNVPRTIGYEDLLRTAVKLGAMQSLNQLFLQMLFNYIFVNQDDHSRNFSFICDSDFKWSATPAYDLTFAKGYKQTVEHQLSLYGKALSLINLDDIVKLATEFSIELEFVSSSLEKLKILRDEKLAKLLKEYDVSEIKQRQILSETSKRNLQGVL